MNQSIILQSKHVLSTVIVLAFDLKTSAPKLGINQIIRRRENEK